MGFWLVNRPCPETYAYPTLWENIGNTPLYCTNQLVSNREKPRVDKKENYEEKNKKTKLTKNLGCGK